ncbi:unnamed protein product [Pylaiella littoralis]
MVNDRMVMTVLIRCWFLVGSAIVLLSAETSDALAVGSASRSIVDTTLPLTADAFRRFAFSPEFYRGTRQQTSTVQQEVVDLSEWASADFAADGAASGGGGGASGDQPGAEAASATATATAAGGAGARLGNILRRQPTPDRDGQQQRQEEQQQQQQQLQPPRPRSWCRKAQLNYAITSPFGSSDATVVQEHTLLEQQESGGIRYRERDCITGFPMVSGDLSVVTTFLVTPALAADDGGGGGGGGGGNVERVRVRVDVAVEEIELPKRFRFLKKPVEKIVRSGGRKQAERWLDEMVEAGLLAVEEVA